MHDFFLKKILIMEFFKQTQKKKETFVMNPQGATLGITNNHNQVFASHLLASPL